MASGIQGKCSVACEDSVSLKYIGMEPVQSHIISLPVKSLLYVHLQGIATKWRKQFAK